MIIIFQRITFDFSEFQFPSNRLEKHQRHAYQLWPKTIPTSSKQNDMEIMGDASATYTNYLE